MDFFNSLIGRNVTSDYQFEVEISESILSRIIESVTSSNIEEGGKFLGIIIPKENRVFVNVQTYIDSGPRVSNSKSHLMPDGEHQEHLFRIIEGYDPEIEHIGSWHSHHCNGYPELSGGDVQGYIENVNHRDYNLDWFFVLLVTQVKGRLIQAKYYMFHRGEKRYYTVHEESVRVVNRVYRYDSILKEVEHTTFSYRKQSPSATKSNFASDSLTQRTAFSPREQNLNVTKSDSSSSSLEEALMSIRAEDKAWFTKNFPSAVVVRNNKDNSLSWKWSIPIEKEFLEMIYTYPNSYNKNLGKATLGIRFRGMLLANVDVELNRTRFNEIEKSIMKTKKDILENYTA